MGDSLSYLDSLLIEVAFSFEKTTQVLRITIVAPF